MNVQPPTPAPDRADVVAPVRRDGFALPLAIVVLALLTMGLVFGFSTASSELSTTVSQRAQARAYSYAQMGLETFLTQRKENTGRLFCPHCWAVNATVPPGGAGITANLDTLPTQRETVYVAFQGGYAIVKATPVWLNVATGKGTYLITSTGYDAQSGLAASLGRSNTAKRTVGVLVTWNKITMNVVGAWTSLSGLVKNGTGRIDGVDQSPTSCANGQNVAGLSVPQYNGRADLVINGGFQPTGSPPYDTLKTFAQESASMKLDWASVKSGVAMPADYIITATNSTFPSTAMFTADTNFWPVIHVMNNPPLPGVPFNFALPNRGRGMLIVDGDLTISGSNQWDGVIMVGGILTSNGNNVSEGATLSGLNALTGTRPSPSSADDATANGQKAYTYNSCSVSKATRAMARYTMMSNTWMDNVSGY